MGAADLDAICLELAESLRSTAGLKRVHPYVVDKIDEAPAAYISAGEPLEFDVRYGRGQIRLTVRIIIVCGRLDSEGAQRVMRRLLSQLPLEESDTALGIKESVESDQTLGGHARTVHCRRADNIRAVTIGAVDWLAVDVVCEVNT